MLGCHDRPAQLARRALSRRPPRAPPPGSRGVSRVRERLPAGVPDDIAAEQFVRMPGSRKATGCHRGRDGGIKYGLQLTGVTSSGVPFLELIQPVAVRRHGHWSVYGAPRPSVTCSAMSSSNGAVSIGFQPWSRGGRIALFPVSKRSPQYSICRVALQSKTGGDYQRASRCRIRAR
jgi:hypothetical protein